MPSEAIFFSSRADVRRQVAEFAGQAGTGRDRMALGEGAHGAGSGSGGASEDDLVQAWRGVGLRQGVGVAVRAGTGEQCELQGLCVAFALRCRQIVQHEGGVAGATCLQHRQCMLEHLAQGRRIGLVRVAAAEQQHARGCDSVHLVQQQALAGGTAEMLVANQPLQRSPRGIVDAGRGATGFAAIGYRKYQAAAVLGSGILDVSGRDFHRNSCLIARAFVLAADYRGCRKSLQGVWRFRGCRKTP